MKEETILIVATSFLIHFKSIGELIKLPAQLLFTSTGFLTKSFLTDAISFLIPLKSIGFLTNPLLIDAISFLPESK